MLKKELDALKEKKLYRTLYDLAPVEGSCTKRSFKGKEYTLFCSNDYLGLAHDKRIKEVVKSVTDSHGTGSGASRLINGTTDMHVMLEKKIAEFKRKEASLCYSTGYMANLGVISALADKNSLIVVDKLNHASIIDACRLSEANMRVYPHNNMSKLEKILQRSSAYKRKIIITDSIFSMDGDAADLLTIVGLKKKYNALLIVDEAHAVGVLGQRGSGLAESLDCEKDIDVTVGTLSKACGLLGGFAAGRKEIIEYLVNKSRAFIYTTALPPAFCAAACKALDLIEEGKERSKLTENINFFKQTSNKLGEAFNSHLSAIFPIIIGEAKEALSIADQLFEEGFFVPAVRPPTVPKGASRLRITLSAAHSFAEIQELINIIAQKKR